MAKKKNLLGKCLQVGQHVLKISKKFCQQTCVAGRVFFSVLLPQLQTHSRTELVPLIFKPDKTCHVMSCHVPIQLDRVALSVADPNCAYYNTRQNISISK